MRILLLGASLALLLGLAGCNLANQSFSCGPTPGNNNIDTGQYTVPALQGPYGPHC